ncbi:YcxB family protein [Clostridium sp. AL.422]|uniref:YcxB family protein n=1 Tax=Clostridium TaxID=1485 RepID=UPI00293DE065|nr:MULTISPECIES: YcxB family protein [unclassified Clostridium]MDV4149945.1 YcxB family protein [Clostridium sp. AL.422]
MRLKFDFKMSVSDYRKMMISQTYGNSWIRRVILFGTWAVFSTLLLLELINIIQLSRVVHLCALLVFVSIPSAAITLEINIIKYKNAYKNGFGAERTIIADEEGFIFVNKSSKESRKNPWTDVSKLEEHKSVFVIQLNHKDAVILPKRSMQNNKQIEEFKGLVNQKIPKYFYPLKNSIFE